MKRRRIGERRKRSAFAKTSRDLRSGSVLDQDTRLLTVKQFFTWAKRDKSNLIEYIMSLLETYPKRKLAQLAYTLTKATLPRLRVTKRKALPKRKTKRKSLAYNGLGFGESLKSMRKKKRKFSQRQLAAQRLFAKRAKAGTLRRR